MRKSQSINTEAVLAKTREILEAEKASATYREGIPTLVTDLSGVGAVVWSDIVGFFDRGMLLEAKVDQLKHEYSVLLTGARPRRPKAKKATKAKRVTATDYLGEQAPYDRGREES